MAEQKSGELPQGNTHEQPASQEVLEQLHKLRIAFRALRRLGEIETSQGVPLSEKVLKTTILTCLMMPLGDARAKEFEKITNQKLKLRSLALEIVWNLDRLDPDTRKMVNQLIGIFEEEIESK